MICKRGKIRTNLENSQDHQTVYFGFGVLGLSQFALWVRFTKWQGHNLINWSSIISICLRATDCAINTEIIKNRQDLSVSSQS